MAPRNRRFAASGPAATWANATPDAALRDPAAFAGILTYPPHPAETGSVRPHLAGIRPVL